ncbi:MAG: hypothetical protein GY731_03510, partial [Gammaproteobacteria bacterium]|nr:hypothetical protein [Gammaproteobacteria bacterium]
PLAAVIPEEAGLVLLVEDMPRLIEKWSRTPLIHGWDDNVLKRMFRSVRRRLLVGHWDDLLRHRLGFTLKEVQGLFRGPTAFVVPDLENIGKKDWSFGLIVDIGDDPGSARELMAAYYKDKAENAPDGVSLHTANESIHGLDAQRIEWWSAGEITETQGWTIIGRHLITARPMAYLSELAMAVGDGERPASLAEADDYRRIQDLNGDGDFLLVADSSQFSGLLQRLSGSDEMVEVDTQEKQIRQKTIPSILTKFDWGRLDRFYLTGNVRDEAVMLEFGTLFDESQNLPELAGFKPGPVELAAFLPDDPLSAVFYNFSHAAQQRSLEE